MTIRKFEDFANSGEINSIYIGGTDASVHKVMTSGDIAISEDWIEPTLLNSWVEYSASYTIGYKKLKNNIVTLKGAIKTGVAPSVILTLPIGYRPIQEACFPVIISDGFAHICISESSGDLTVLYESNIGGSTTFLQFDSISFLAEA